eukprot:scaffold76920_cov32-Tisochrysis_lutea.AAC.3
MSDGLRLHRESAAELIQRLGHKVATQEALAAKAMNSKSFITALRTRPASQRSSSAATIATRGRRTSRHNSAAMSTRTDDLKSGLNRWGANPVTSTRSISAYIHVGNLPRLGSGRSVLGKKDAVERTQMARWCERSSKPNCPP